MSRSREARRLKSTNLGHKARPTVLLCRTTQLTSVPPAQGIEANAINLSVYGGLLQIPPRH